MAEPEVLVPIRCPICLQESLAGFRFSVLEDALATGEIRLYANCHVTSWQGSAPELAAMRDYLDTVWGTGLQKSCPAFFELDRFLDGDSLSFDLYRRAHCRRDERGTRTCAKPLTP